MITKEQLVEHLEELNGCCLHLKFDVARVRKPIFAWCSACDDGDPACGTDRYGFIIFRTTDGKFAVLSDSEDYTGYGCQCRSDISEADTLEELVRLGLTDEDREIFVHDVRDKRRRHD